MNIFIVDDEPIVREGLRKLVDWEAHGFRWVGEAGDGAEALEKMREQKVDILVTDILMPRMDGLELIRRLDPPSADLGVLVLSCLDDFAYVKEAMKLGARDYVLKPTMEPEELVANLAEIRAELERQRENARQVRQWQRQIEETKPMQLALRLRSFLDFGRADERLEAELFAQGGVFTLMVCGLPAAPLAYMERPLGEALAAVPWQDRRLLLVFPAERSGSRQEQYRAAFAKASAVAARLENGGADFFVGLGPVIADLGGFAEAFALHERQVDARFYGGGGRVVGDVPPQPEAALPYECRGDLLRAVDRGNMAAALHQAELLCRRIRGQRPPVQRLLPFLHELLAQAAAHLRSTGSRGAEAYEQRYASPEAVQGFISADALCAWLLQAVRELFDSGIGGVLSLSANPFVRKAHQFMLDNFRRNLSMVDIADHVKLSRSYLSDLYSRETGEPLSETLARIRINEAKRLLRAGEMKIYEIAEAVGFADPKSFAKTFKKIVGCTPKEYEARGEEVFR
jgi:two-component system response regulator YesN